MKISIAGLRFSLCIIALWLNRGAEILSVW